MRGYALPIQLEAGHVQLFIFPFLRLELLASFLIPLILTLALFLRQILEGRWSKSVLGSVAQPDACGMEPLQAVALVVFRCQLKTLSRAILGHDNFSCLDGHVKPFVAIWA